MDIKKEKKNRSHRIQLKKKIKMFPYNVYICTRTFTKKKKKIIIRGD